MNKCRVQARRALCLTIVSAPSCSLAPAYDTDHNHADQIPIAELEAQVPAHAQNHDFRIEVTPHEQFFDGSKLGHSSIFAHPFRFVPEPN